MNQQGGDGKKHEWFIFTTLFFFAPDFQKNFLLVVESSFEQSNVLGACGHNPKIGENQKWKFSF